MSHSYESHSDYGGEEKKTRPKEHLNYGEKNQNMKGDPKEESMQEQPEKTEPTRNSSYNIGPTGGNPNVSDDLKQRVVAALQQNTSIDSEEITVNIKDNNCVELKGTVSNEQMISSAVQTVRGLGVKDIDNDLKVA